MDFSRHKSASFIILIVFTTTVISSPTPLGWGTDRQISAPQDTVTVSPHRMKRSPFIMAFQVTRPPGMFHMSLRRPAIFNMMSNLTRSFLTSNITEMLRRGFVGPIGVTTGDSGINSTTNIQSRQEDLEIFK